MALIWHGNKVAARIRTRAWKDVQAATLIVEAAVKASMSLGGTTESGEATYEMATRTVRGGARGGIRAGLRVGEKYQVRRLATKKMAKVGTYTSKPGEIPRVQTGDLRESITTEMDPRGLPIGRVGTNLPYGRPLELGYPPNNLAPRPFMRPALHKSEAAIKAKFSEPMVGD